MKKLLSGILLAFSLHSAIADIKSPNSEWEILSIAPQQPFKVYVDKSSLGKDETTSFNYGVILIVSPDPIKITVNGKVVVFNSMARFMMASCNDMIVANMIDYQFNVPGGLPKPDDVSVSVIDYGSKPIIHRVSKDSWVYKTLCPTYI